MKKIGIYLNSNSCDRYLYKSIEKLSQSTKVELHFLRSTKREIEEKSFRLSFFKLVTKVEHTLLSILNRDIKEHRRVFSIDESDITLIENSDKMKQLDLDLIIDIGNSDRELVKFAKDGVISLRYSSSKEPLAFWEVYNQESSSRFSIELSNKNMKTETIFKGEIQTQRSYTENMVYLFSNSTPYLTKIILDYASANRLPSTKERVPSTEPTSTIPTFSQLVYYILKTTTIISSIIINRFIFKKERRWSVAFLNSPWRDANLRDGIEIKNPSNRFFADPFVITRDNRTICFVEDYYYNKSRACISAVEIKDDNSYTILGTIIDEPFHMSFPFIFEYKDELYMTPETCEADSIRLYKCIEFPMRWEYQKDIISNISATDSIIFEHDSRWWLLCNMAIDGNSDYSSTLMAFYSDNPLADKWIAHELNPLIFDSKIARNGGVLNIKSGKLPIRSRQKQGFGEYGESFSLAQIEELTPSSYKEREIGKFSATFFENIKTCHHIHSNDKYTVYDYMRCESIT